MTTKREAADGVMAEAQSIIVHFADELGYKSEGADQDTADRCQQQIDEVNRVWERLDRLRAEWLDPAPLTGRDAR